MVKFEDELNIEQREFECKIKELEQEKRIAESSKMVLERDVKELRGLKGEKYAAESKVNQLKSNYIKNTT